MIQERSFLVCSRKGSNTETNLHRNPKCAVHFIEFNRKQLKKIVGLGYPGQTTEEKMADSPFTLIESPTPGRGTADGCPPIIKEAFQVYEAHWDESFRIKDDGRTPEYLVLRLENILLKETWAKNIENGTRRMPNMPITFGFRDGEKFWFAERKNAFWFPTPTDKGAKEESVLYEANRIDPEVRFTREACKQLTGIPKPFIKTALEGNHQAGQGTRRHRGRPRIRRDAEQGARLTALAKGSGQVPPRGTRYDRRPDLVKNRVGKPVDLLGGPVQYRVRRIHGRAVKTYLRALLLERLPERGRQNADAGNTQVVEIVQVMGRTGCA